MVWPLTQRPLWMSRPGCRKTLKQGERALPRQFLWDKMKKTTICVLAAALLMMGFGLWRGEGRTVLSKGINLCMECVGIG